MPIANSATKTASQLPVAATVPVAAHAMDVNASENVAMRDEVCLRRNWLLLAWERNHS